MPLELLLSVRNAESNKEPDNRIDTLCSKQKTAHITIDECFHEILSFMMPNTDKKGRNIY